MTRKGAWGPLRTHELADAAATRPKRRRRRRSTKKRSWGEEAAIQKAWVEWARAAGLEVQHQNNGSDNKRARIHLWEMGCAAGAADILVFDRLPRDPEARGLALEFKTQDGEQSADQIRWQRRVERLGWRYHVVRSKEEAIEVVTWYGLP